MFEGFEDKKDAAAKKRWMASAGTSLAIYAVIGGALAVAAGKTVHEMREEDDVIDVTFQEELEPEPEAKKAEPPPPPPQAVAAKKKAGRKPLVAPPAVPDKP